MPPVLTDVVHRQWGEGLIGSWTEHDWWDAPVRVGDAIGQLIGAAPGRTVAGDSTSVQLFNALGAAAALRPDRTVLVTDPGHFPTDRYLAEAVARQRGLRVRQVRPADLERFLAEEGDQVAAVSYSPVDYRTGELYDWEALTRAAHRVGALAVWDLCHAAGAFPLRLDDAGVDLAVGCGYKFLSGGPGALSLPVRGPPSPREPAHAADRLERPRRPLRPHGDYVPAPGIARARIGTPPILSLLALEAALTAFDGVDLEQVRAKSLSLTGFFLRCAEELLAPLGFTAATPSDPERRASQVSLRHPHAYGLVRALARHGVVADMRAPDILRFGVNALYTTHQDMLTAAVCLRDITVAGTTTPHRRSRAR